MNQHESDGKLPRQPAIRFLTVQHRTILIQMSHSVASWRLPVREEFMLAEPVYACAYQI